MSEEFFTHLWLRSLSKYFAPPVVDIQHWILMELKLFIRDTDLVEILALESKVNTLVLSDHFICSFEEFRLDFSRKKKHDYESFLRHQSSDVQYVVSQYFKDKCPIEDISVSGTYSASAENLLCEFLKSLRKHYVSLDKTTSDPKTKSSYNIL